MQLSVKQARLMSEKTQLQVAKAMRICVQTYRKLEENSEMMTIAQARLFCEAVGRSMDEVIF